MEMQSGSHEPCLNRVVAVGVLDRQMLGGREQLRVAHRNPLSGASEQIVLQVPSPFGQSYALTLQLDEHTAGIAELASVQAGMPVAVHGRLLCEQRLDLRFPAVAGSLRRLGELTIAAQAFRLAEPGEQAGCDVQLRGIVQAAPRVVRHPVRHSVLLATTTLLVPEEHWRAGMRSRIVASDRIALVVPLHHPHAPRLLRPGNLVVVEGMLERVVVQLHGEDIVQAQAALDRTWQARRAAIGSTDALRELDRQHSRQRRRLGEAIRSRVVVGYVELVEGSPASLRDAQRQRPPRHQPRRGISGGSP
jgi:hypothetical protein